MARTKRAKSVEVVDMIQQIEERVTKYTCPSCRVTIIGGPCTGRAAIRFICECGQELIIKRRRGVYVDKFYQPRDPKAGD